MEHKKLERAKELVNQIAEYYDLPTEEETAEIRELTGIDWEAEELQLECCEYWGHNSLEETAYLLFHGEYPPTREDELVFWKEKPGVSLEAQAVYEKYRLGRGTLGALEPLPLEEILRKIGEAFPGWEQDVKAGRIGRSYRFNCPEQKADWTDTHFWIFAYGRETEVRREHQLLCFLCHNMEQGQTNAILECMDSFQCPLRIREERNF